MSVLELVGPFVGPCGLCGGPDQRHRIADAVHDLVDAGEDPEAIAEDYGLTETAVVAIAAASEEERFGGPVPPAF